MERLICGNMQDYVYV